MDSAFLQPFRFVYPDSDDMGSHIHVDKVPASSISGLGMRVDGSDGTCRTHAARIRDQVKATAEDLALCVLICMQIVDGFNALLLALSCLLHMAKLSSTQGTSQLTYRKVHLRGKRDERRRARAKCVRARSGGRRRRNQNVGCCYSCGGRRGIKTKERERKGKWKVRRPTGQKCVESDLLSSQSYSLSLDAVSLLPPRG